jgi:signal peptidase I
MFLFLSRYFFSAVAVLGPSMKPTLEQGDRRFLKRWIFYFREPERGDVVAVARPGERDLAVKRIVGLPGETLLIDDSRIYINGTALTEPYLGERISTYPHAYGATPLTLGPDQYFVAGDNRNNSEDSRAYGPLSRDMIKGLIAP